MNHKVNNVGQLYDDAVGLYKNVVLGEADVVIDNLNQAITVLESNWEGKDACVQINNIIKVHNAMVTIRNVLANLSKDCVTIAIDYREIQNANKANLGSLEPLSPDSLSPVESFDDNRDTININPEAENGKAKLDAAIDGLERFISDVRSKYDAIMGNWLVGTGRDKAQDAFDNFMNKTNKYQQTLSDVSTSIATALRNYTM